MTDMRLADAPWLHAEGLRAIVAALDGHAKIVGGAVRDSLLDLTVSDIDLATPLLPDDVTKRLELAGIKAIPTGIEHGTITAIASGQSFEITTLRRDVATDGRRATVAFSTEWRDDAARRDFTMNALYADPANGEISDYFGGLQDLNSGILRFIGNAEERIAEDHLRILRFFRFHARYGKGAPDSAALAACQAASNSLMSLSRERIADELLKLLALPDPLSSVQLMFDHAIFAAFLPEVDDISRLARLLKREAERGTAPSAGRRLSALLPSDAAIIESIGARLKLSNKLRAALATRTSVLDPDSTLAHALGYRLGVPMAIDLFLLHGRDDDWRAGADLLDGWLPPIFAVKGGELVTRGLSAGPDVAKTLQAVEQAWINEGFPGAERAYAIADQLVAEKLSDKKP
jgi:poly(A) polymerase